MTGSDIFESKSIKPMLIGRSEAPFNSPDHIFELKLDGERCIAYLDPGSGTELLNKREMRMLPKVPELAGIHRQVRSKCVLDGELIVVKDGKPDFFEIQRRSLTSDKFRIRLAAERLPASYIAFDILYSDGSDLTGLPLTERKRILDGVMDENARISVSRVVEERGIDFYNLTVEQDLEGIVAKSKHSRYVPGTRTKDWIKIKNLADDDFVVCGYIEKEAGIVSVVLGQYDGTDLVYKGHVTLGVSGADFRTIRSSARSARPPFAADADAADDGAAVWLEPSLVCTVKYMMKNRTGSMRQPVFKGLRPDKSPDECVVS